jgi:protein subunit release factor B
MSDRAPKNPQRCTIDIVALIGGDESHAFVDMMLTMYRLWAYNHHYAIRLLEPAEWKNHNTIGRVKLLIEGADWEMLASRENGVHRIIRIPPGQTQRHMSFVGVRVSDAQDAPLPRDQDGWGEQIRSLMVNPEPALKNHRTGFVCTDIVGVMAGDLEQFWEERS